MAGKGTPQAPRGMGAELEKVVERKLRRIVRTDTGWSPQPRAMVDVVASQKHVPAIGRLADHSAGVVTEADEARRIGGLRRGRNKGDDSRRNRRRPKDWLLVGRECGIGCEKKAPNAESTTGPHDRSPSGRGWCPDKRAGNLGSDGDIPRQDRRGRDRVSFCRSPAFANQGVPCPRRSSRAENGTGSLDILCTFEKSEGLQTPSRDAERRSRSAGKIERCDVEEAFEVLGSMRGATAQKMLVAVRCHPFGAGEMALEGLPRTGGLLRRIDMENDPGDLGPIRPFGIGIEKPQIGDEVLLVVARQRIGRRRRVLYSWGQRGFWHGALPAGRLGFGASTEKYSIARKGHTEAEDFAVRGRDEALDENDLDDGCMVVAFEH